MQRSRRATPYPFTWEVPLALAVAALFLLLTGVQVGRSLANVVAGNGWVFIDRPRLFSSLGGIFTGDASAGMAGLTHPAGPALLWTSIAVTELGVLIGYVVALKWGLDRWGPGRVHGVATRSEAEALLGRSRLRHHANVIRPDLYGSSKGGIR